MGQPGYLQRVEVVSTVVRGVECRADRRESGAHAFRRVAHEKTGKGGSSVRLCLWDRRVACGAVDTRRRAHGGLYDS